MDQRTIGLLQLNNKRGLSEVVAYTLLILISISLATAAYFYMEGFIAKPGAECQDGVSVAITDSGCDIDGGSVELNFNLYNTGTFTIYDFFIRANNSKQKIGAVVYSPQTASPKNTAPGKSTSWKVNQAIASGDAIFQETFASLRNGDKIMLEVQPVAADLKDPRLAANCQRAIVRKEVTCTVR